MTDDKYKWSEGVTETGRERISKEIAAKRKLKLKFSRKFIKSACIVDKLSQPVSYTV